MFKSREQTTPTGLNKQIFLSYASEQENIAKQIAMALTTSGHDVFFSPFKLRAGKEFRNAIHEAIRTSDLFVFLISPESVSDGAYTKTELKFAEETWPTPIDRILPVLVATTDFEVIPPYLKEVTILRPEGNIPAEVTAAVNDLAAGISSEKTFSERMNLIEKIAEEAKRLRRQQRVSQIEEEWRVVRQRYLVKTPSGTTGEPSKGVDVIVAFWGGLALLVYVLTIRNDPGHGFLDWLFVSLPLLMGAVVGLLKYRNALDYEKAKEYYLERMREASADSGNDEKPVATLRSDQTK